MRACVIIPAYNEAQAIGDLIRAIHLRKIDVLVIDDGSMDGTSGVAQSAGAVVLRNVSNRGKGASLSRGFKYAMEQGFDAVITMDGDGQHLAEDIPLLIGRAQASASGIFIGNRMQETQQMPCVRILTNMFMSWLISVVTMQNIPDSQCGFRLIKKDTLHSFSLTSFKFEMETELLLKAARHGIRIESIPVKTVYSDERSHINPFWDTLRFIAFMIRQIWTMPY
ncbi:MAG: glycosyltransferase family 2 protein [Candidatus Omnitrophota bacterium]|jgi:glycosyltransferase involved in cell wall biosynthesis|nr:MAG: glycosyltransferase family 2 protein [Candidatus Omnitrophota bacterium]